MKSSRIYFLGGDTREAHNAATQLGFTVGQYVVIVGYGDSTIRGMRNQTMYVVGNAANRDDYNHIVGDALMNGFTVVDVNDETIQLVINGEC